MDPLVMVLGIVLITSVAGVWKAKHGVHRGRRGEEHRVDAAENARLYDEVRALKERIQVLERITVEKENSLDRQIEALRDR